MSDAKPTGADPESLSPRVAAQTLRRYVAGAPVAADRMQDCVEALFAGHRPALDDIVAALRESHDALDEDEPLDSRDAIVEHALAGGRFEDLPAEIAADAAAAGFDVSELHRGAAAAREEWSVAARLARAGAEQVARLDGGTWLPPVPWSGSDAAAIAAGARLGGFEVLSTAFDFATWGPGALPRLSLRRRVESAGADVQIAIQPVLTGTAERVSWRVDITLAETASASSLCVGLERDGSLVTEMAALRVERPAFFWLRAPVGTPYRVRLEWLGADGRMASEQFDVPAVHVESGRR